MRTIAPCVGVIRHDGESSHFSGQRHERREHRPAILLSASAFILVSLLLGSFRTYLLVLDWIRSDDTSFPPLLLVSVLYEPFARRYVRWISLVRFSNSTWSL